jgi:hypothetical protein
LYSILHQACLSASHAATLFRLPLFLPISRFTISTMRVTLLQMLLLELNYPVDQQGQQSCSLTIFSSDTNSLIQRLHLFPRPWQQTRQSQNFESIAATSALAAALCDAQSQKKP